MPSLVGSEMCIRDRLTAGDCFFWMKRATADKIEELVDRCARYAEEIAVLRKKVNA